MNKYTYVYYTASTQLEILKFIEKWRHKGFTEYETDYSKTKPKMKVIMRKENK